MKKTKSKSQYQHAQKRFKERFGITFGHKMRNDIINIIKNGKAELIEKQSLRVSIWAVEYENTHFKIVYDNKRHNIATVLPKDA